MAVQDVYFVGSTDPVDPEIAIPTPCYRLGRLAGMPRMCPVLFLEP